CDAVRPHAQRGSAEGGLVVAAEAVEGARAQGNGFVHERYRARGYAGSSGVGADRGCEGDRLIEHRRRDRRGDGGRRGVLVHHDGGLVLSVAVVLVDDPTIDRVSAGDEVESLRRGGTAAGIGGGRQRIRAETKGVMEAGRRVGRGWVERVAEADGRRIAEDDWAVVTECGRGRRIAQGQRRNR